jgi:hypothetical protein
VLIAISLAGAIVGNARELKIVHGRSLACSDQIQAQVIDAGLTLRLVYVRKAAPPSDPNQQTVRTVDGEFIHAP